MQIHLLRELLNDALNEPNEERSVSGFWCYAPDYDECIPIFKKIFLNEKMKSIASDECKVKRIKNGFLIEDCYGSRDIFSIEEMRFLIDLWEKTLKVKVNIIDLDSE